MVGPPCSGLVVLKGRPVIDVTNDIRDSLHSVTVFVHPDVGSQRAYKVVHPGAKDRTRATDVFTCATIAEAYAEVDRCAVHVKVRNVTR